MEITITAPNTVGVTFTLTDQQLRFLRREYDGGETVPQMLHDIIMFWLDTNMGEYFGATQVDVDLHQER